MVFKANDWLSRLFQKLLCLALAVGLAGSLTAIAAAEPDQALAPGRDASAPAANKEADVPAKRVVIRFLNQTAPARRGDFVEMESSTAKRSGGFGHASFSTAMQRLGDELGSVEAIVAAMESERLRAQPAMTPDGPEVTDDASALERSLAAIWKKALGRSGIGFTENFFDAGGTSLKAVVVVAMIRRELKRNVSVISLFECPSIRLLAARLDGSEDSADKASAAASGAESRGRQRRGKLIKRRIA